MNKRSHTLNHKTNRFFLIATAVVTGFSIISGWVNSEYGSLYFVPMRYDYFMDLFNPIYFSRDPGVYTEQASVYPPILLLSLRIGFGWIKATSALELRGILLPFSLLLLAIAAFSPAYIFISHKDAFGLSKAEIITLTLAIVSTPAMCYALERMNTILLAYLLMIMTISSCLGQRTRRQFDREMMSFVFICSCIKPYFILMAALPLFHAKQALLKKVLTLLVFLLVYLAVNELPFAIGVYKGSIFDWFSSVGGFNSNAISDNAWMSYAISHYSYSFQSILSSFPHKGLEGFSAAFDNNELGYSVGSGAATLSKISDLSILVFIGYCIMSLTFSLRKYQRLLRPKPGLEKQAAIIQLVAAIALVLPVCIYAPQSGYYLGTIALPVVIAAYILDAPRRITILTLICLYCLASSSFSYILFPSFISAALFWMLVTYCLHSVVLSAVYIGMSNDSPNVPLGESASSKAPQ